MNYNAPTRNMNDDEPISVSRMLTILFTFFEQLYDLVIGFPLFILEKAGLNIQQLFSVNCTLGSLCVCGAFLGITASIGIGLGVGLGVGLSCANDQSFNASVPNTTNVNSTNANLTLF